MPLPHRTPDHRCTPRPIRRPDRLAVLFLAALGGGGLAIGCTTDVFRTTTTRPVAPPAESCVARCNLQKSQCQARQETREKGCQDNLARGKADYEQCRTAAIRQCLPPVTCLGADMSICDRQYEPCIADCGGPRDRNPAGADAARATEPEAVADSAVVTAGTGAAPPPGAVQTALPRKTNQEQATAAKTQARTPASKKPPTSTTETTATPAPQPQESAPR